MNRAQPHARTKNDLGWPKILAIVLLAMIPTAGIHCGWSVISVPTGIHPVALVMNGRSALSANLGEPDSHTPQPNFRGGPAPLDALIPEVSYSEAGAFQDHPLPANGTKPTAG